MRDPNDYPLLDWGLEVAEDIDVLARQMLHTVDYLKPSFEQENVQAETSSTVDNSTVSNDNLAV